MLRRSAWLFALLPILACGASSPDAEIASSASALVFDPQQWPSLQAAIDAAPNGAVIQLGARTLYEPVAVSGKRITLVGAGRNATKLDGANVPGPLVTLGTGGDLRLEGLTLESPRTAIASLAPNGNPGALRIVDVSASGTDASVSGAFASLRARGADLAGPVDVKDTATIVFERVTAHAGLGATPAVRIDNRGLASGPCIVVLDRVTALAGEAGGIAVLGGRCPVYGAHVGVAGARVFGVGFFQTKFAWLFDAHVVNTKATPLGDYGDGVVAWASHVELVDSRVENSARGGVSVFGCDADATQASVTLTGTELRCNAFDMDYEDVSVFTPSLDCSSKSATFVDGGLDQCRTCGGEAKTCMAITSTLKPITP